MSPSTIEDIIGAIIEHPVIQQHAGEVKRKDNCCVGTLKIGSKFCRGPTFGGEVNLDDSSVRLLAQIGEPSKRIASHAFHLLGVVASRGVPKQGLGLWLAPDGDQLAVEAFARVPSDPDERAFVLGALLDTFVANTSWFDANLRFCALVDGGLDHHTASTIVEAAFSSFDQLWIDNALPALFPQEDDADEAD